MIDDYSESKGMMSHRSLDGNPDRLSKDRW